jgi:hypothetical protein
MRRLPRNEFGDRYQCELRSLAEGRLSRLSRYDRAFRLRDCFSHGSGLNGRIFLRRNSIYCIEGENSYS